MIGRLRRPRDPFWGDGRGARRTQRRVRLEGLVALSLAIVACGVAAALWLLTLAPLVDRIGLR
jgi:fructose-1,6-bisphosphatase/inositol monophosphatase family enzyme